jgi:hypothetical protein
MLGEFRFTPMRIIYSVWLGTLRESCSSHSYSQNQSLIALDKAGKMFGQTCGVSGEMGRMARLVGNGGGLKQAQARIERIPLSIDGRGSSRYRLPEVFPGSVRR